MAATAGVIAVVVYVFVVGWILELVRFGAARLPAFATAEQLSAGHMLGYGLLSTLLMVVVVAASCALAHLTAARKWDVNRQDWHDIVNYGVAAAAARPDAMLERGRRERRHSRMVAQRAGRVNRRLGSRGLGVLADGPARIQRRAQLRAAARPRGAPKPLEAAPAGDWAVRVVAGFNIMVISGLLAVGVARLVGSLIPFPPWAAVTGWLGVAVGVVVFLASRWLLTKWSPLVVPARLHGLVWGLVAVATLFASAPLGVLVLTGVLISTLGRRLARRSPPSSAAQFARSPLLWALLGVCTLLAVAYTAMPPVVFPEATVTTAAGDLVGGYVASGDAGTYVVTCTALADATSTAERLRLVPAADVRSIRIAGASYYLESGERPSIARLVLHGLGLGADPPTLFSAPLRARRPTCGGTYPSPTSPGVADPALGVGVIAGPAPAGGRANDGEAPIQDNGQTPARVAALARRYQPTVLVTAADRNWPVSLNAVLAERGPDGQPVCLIRPGAKPVCGPTAGDIGGLGATSGGYLQLPVSLSTDRSPNGQFQAFLRGQYQSSGPLRQWLADPARLDPWYSAQLYFYYAGPIATSQWPARAVDPNVPSGLIGLEYWFYYPFNYYPLVVDSGLMDGAPIAGDEANVDLHQGDWEHVDVLLDPRSDEPVWLYLARHDYEGKFIPWTSPSLRFDAGHPVIQAAFGGHPSYLPGCGPAPRTVTLDASSDWLSCGSGRFAFRGATTPLVDMARVPWACWPGYFGEATNLELSHSGQSESVIETVKHTLFVHGPFAPLRQAENLPACRHGPTTPELEATSPQPARRR